MSIKHLIGSTAKVVSAPVMTTVYLAGIGLSGILMLFRPKYGLALAIVIVGGWAFSKWAARKRED